MADVTPSTTQMMPVYMDAIHAISTDLSGATVIYGAPITSNSEAASYRTFPVAFPPYDPLIWNEDDYKQEIVGRQRDLANKFTHLLGERDKREGTDLLHCFAKPAAILNGGACGKARVKSLIVLSDGIQQTSEVDFMRVALTNHQDGLIIKRLRSNGELPNLAGVRVWMVGCGADPTASIPPDKITEIKRFWISYFKAVGADLTMDRCGSSLENYP